MIQLAALALLVQAPAQQTLLRAVPEDTAALVYCADPVGFLDRARQNDWVRLFSSDRGEPMLEDLERELTPWIGHSVQRPLGVAVELHGPTFYFQSPSLSGLVTLPPPNRDALVGAMRGWMESRFEPAVPPVPAPIPTGTLLLSRPPTSEAGPSFDRPAAMLDHPQLLGLFVGSDVESLSAGVKNLIAAIAAESRPAIAERFLAERTRHDALDLEIFVDYGHLGPLAQPTLETAAEGHAFDPARLLGLEEDTWLYLTAALHPGERIDCRGRLRIPQDTLAAKLADTFEVLPGDLASQIPKSAYAAWALRWNLASAFEIAREEMKAQGHEQEAAQLDGVVGGASMATGVDFEKSFLSQLDGIFLAFLGEDGEEGTSEAPSSDIPSFGIQLGIRDRDEFERVFDALVDLTSQDFAIEAVEGTDAYVFQDDLELDGGFAILPHRFLFAARRLCLLDTLSALQGEASASASGSRLDAAVAERRSATLFTSIELNHLRDLMRRYGEVPEDYAALWPSSADEPDPFAAQLVGSMSRVPEGFEILVTTR